MSSKIYEKTRFKFEKPENKPRSLLNKINTVSYDCNQNIILILLRNCTTIYLVYLLALYRECKTHPRQVYAKDTVLLDDTCIHACGWTNTPIRDARVENQHCWHVQRCAVSSTRIHPSVVGCLSAILYDYARGCKVLLTGQWAVSLSTLTRVTFA